MRENRKSEKREEREIEKDRQKKLNRRKSKTEKLIDRKKEERIVETFCRSRGST